MTVLLTEQPVDGPRRGSRFPGKPHGSPLKRGMTAKTLPRPVAMGPSARRTGPARIAGLAAERVGPNV
ncbi:hypothetical protein AMK24_20625 [Streptomyces sp. CB02366]|nr:hypothetical protein AMK24_20625 [Streptomyces sp. CB02366]